MSVKVIRRTVQSTETIIDATEFRPCCTAWALELGRSLRLSPDGDGVLPDSLFRRVVVLADARYRQLKTSWGYCPYCGSQIKFDIIEGEDVTSGQVRIPALDL
jgi:hypothetical protein